MQKRQRVPVMLVNGGLPSVRAERKRLEDGSAYVRGDEEQGTPAPRHFLCSPAEMFG